jgi:hypothetical protein
LGKAQKTPHVSKVSTLSRFHIMVVRVQPNTQNPKGKRGCKKMNPRLISKTSHSLNLIWSPSNG